MKTEGAENGGSSEAGKASSIEKQVHVVALTAEPEKGRSSLDVLRCEKGPGISDVWLSIGSERIQAHSYVGMCRSPLRRSASRERLSLRSSCAHVWCALT